MADADATDKMLSHRAGAVGHMVFNNPERHNAVSLDMWDAAEAILDGFEKDGDVRVVVLSGAGGRSFVSGADISRFEKERGSAEAVARYNARVKAVYERITALAMPTIAMIDGYCLGGGLNLAVACDVRFCSEKSSFAMPAAKLGLGYPMHAIRRLAAVIGIPAAKDLMFSARRIDAAEAFRIGLVHRVVPEAELAQAVDEYAAMVAANAPLTVRAMKFIAGEIAKDEDARDLAACEEMVRACFASEDYVEGRTAFMEKRKPAFKGR